VLIGEIEVLFAEQDTIVTVTKNDKQTDFFIGNLTIFAFSARRPSLPRKVHGAGAIPIALIERGRYAPRGQAGSSVYPRLASRVRLRLLPRLPPRSGGSGEACLLSSQAWLRSKGRRYEEFARGNSAPAPAS
jgi:hypothetical protein